MKNTFILHVIVVGFIDWNRCVIILVISILFFIIIVIIIFIFIYVFLIFILLLLRICPILSIVDRCMLFIQLRLRVILNSCILYHIAHSGRHMRGWWRSSSGGISNE